MSDLSNSSGPVIDLYEYAGVGLLIPFASGVRYTNQTGGIACHHPSLEGVFAPLDCEHSSPLEKLTQYFTGKKWKGCCDCGIDAETADFLDTLFSEHIGTLGLKVDRAQLQRCEEAWIHVIIAPEHVHELWSGFGNSTGIFTWMNSD